MSSGRVGTRVAVAQFACHPALVQPNRSPLEDPLFSFKSSVDTLPTPGSVPDALQERIRALRARVRETYCRQLMLRLRAIVSTCRALSVDVLVLPEYSVPWQVLDELAAVCGDLVLVAGTHTVTREAKRSGVYERLGALDVPLNEAVSPVLHRGKFLALQPKLNPAKPEAATLQPGARWESIALPSPLPSPLGVLICLDFLVDPGFEPEAVTRDKLAACRLLAVPSWTPTKTLEEFRGRAWVRSERHRTPVLYANVADEGGSTIFAEDDAVHDLLRFPEHIGALGRGEEGLVVADLDLSMVRPGHATPYGWRPPVHPVALASLVYRAHPVAEEYVQWLDALAPLLARDDDAACDALVDAVTRDKLVLQRVAMLPGADARARRLRRLVGDADQLGRVEDVRRLVREVVLPEDAVPFETMRAAMAKGAAEALLGWMGEKELRPHQRMLAELRDRLDHGAKGLATLERDEWTDAGLRAVGDVTRVVQGENRTRESEPRAGRVESPSLPPDMDPAAMPDFTDGNLRVVFRRSVDEVRSTVDRLPVREAPLPNGKGRADYEILSNESLDYRARQLLLLLQAEGVAPLAVVGLAPLDSVFSGVIAIVSTRGDLWRLYAIAEDTNKSDWHSELLPEVLTRAGARSVELTRVTADELERRARALLPIIASAREEIARIREERLREVQQQYVDPDVRVGEREGPAREMLDGWVCEARTHVALVLGAFGSGKSTALADWCLHRWQDEPDVPFPVLVSLAGTGDSADPIGMLLRAARLKETAAHQSAIRLLTTLGYLLPCFDGFDEMATRIQPSALAGRLAALTGIVRDGGRVMVSSRSHYFPTEKELRDTERALAEALHQSGPHTRIEVLPFTDEKVARLVREVVGDDDAPAVLRRIETTYDLRDLASRPLLLAMVLRTLERIPEGRRITQAVLYDEYLERWLEQTDVGDRDCFTHDQKRAFAEALAETLWRSGHTAVGWSTLRDSVRAQLFRELPDDVPPGAALLEIAGGAFFVRDGEDQFRFAHKSFLEYFLARALVQALSRGRVDVLDTRPLTREVIDFVHEVIVRDAPDDPQRHGAIETLSGWLRTGRRAERTLAATAVVAANALRLLHGLARTSTQRGWMPEEADLRGVVLLGEDLEGLDARRAQLQHADLRGCRLKQSTLDGCDLTQARLDGAVLDAATLQSATLRSASLCMAEAKGCDLRGADLRDANLAQSVWVDARWDDVRHAQAHGDAAVWTGGTLVPRGEGLTLKAILRSGHSSIVTSVSWSPDGTRVASGSHDETVRVWDVSRSEVVATLQGHADVVSSVSWSPDGTCVASGSYDATVCVWDVSRGDVVATLQGHAREVTSVSWSPDGTRVASGSHDQTVRVWDVSRIEVVATLLAHEHGVTSVSWSPDGTRVASGSWDQPVRVWDVSRGEVVATFQGHDHWVTSVSWSPDGTRVASGSYDSTVRVWDVSRGEVVATLQEHDLGVYCVSWSPDGTTVASGSYDSTVHVWDVSRGEVVATLDGHVGEVNSVSWSPDGTHVASGAWDHTVRVWDVSRGEVVATLKGHARAVTSVSWSPDGTRVASGSDDGTVRVWDVSRGEVVAALQGHDSGVTSVSWSPDGTRVASGSRDQTVRVWDVSRGEMVATLQGHDHWVTSVSWSPDGTRVASGSRDQTVRVHGAAVSERIPWRPFLALHVVGDASLATIPSGYVVAHDTVDAPLRLGVRVPGPSRATLFTPPGALRAVFHRPDLVARFLRGEVLDTTPDDDLRALGWNPGPPWDGGPVTLHDTLTVDVARSPLVARVAADATAFVPGRALMGLDTLPGRAELVDTALSLCAVRNPLVVRGPRRAGKTSLLHTLVRRLALTHDVHLCTLEGGVASRHDLARRMMPALADTPHPADALLRHPFAREVVFLVDELGWLTRLPPEDLAWLRAVAQHVGTVLLAGSHQDWTDAVRHARRVPGSSFGNDFEMIDVGPLAEHDAVSFLTTHGSPDAPVSEPVARWIVDLCGAWAFYLQVMGFWVQQETRAGRPPVTREQVREIRHRHLIVGRDTAFAGRWDELPRLARSTLFDHRDGRFPRLDDLAQPTQDALLGAGICAPSGLWLQDAPFYDWIRLHATKLEAALRAEAN